MRYVRTIGIAILITVSSYDLYSIIDSFSGISSGIVGLYDLVIVDLVFSLPAAGVLLALSVFCFIRDHGFPKWIAFLGIITSGLVLLLNAAQFILALLHYYS